MVEGRENWRLILEATRSLTAAGRSPFGRIEVYEWIWERFPRADHDRGSLDPIFQGMIANAPGGPTGAGGTPLRRVNPGQYVLSAAAGTTAAEATPSPAVPPVVQRVASQPLTEDEVKQ